MTMLRSILRQQVVVQHPRNKFNLDFTIEALKCRKGDEHTFSAVLVNTEEDVPPFACCFNTSLLEGNLLAVADEEGGVYLFDVRKKCCESMLKGWIAHSNAIFDIAWVDNEPKLVTASGDQTAQLWDIQYSTRLGVFRGHSSSVKSVDFENDSQFVFATGSRDGNIMIWDVRCNKREGFYKPVNTIRNCHSTISQGAASGSKKKRKRSVSLVSQDSQQSVTSVKYQDKNKIVSAGAVDGNIKVWDLRKNYSILQKEAEAFHVFPYPGSSTRKHGFSSLVFDSHKSRLFANCTNDIIYMYDCVAYKSSSPLCSYQGHSNTTFYVKSAISPDDQFLMSGSGDCNVHIWNIDKPYSAPFQLVGHAGEVTSVAWCPRDQAKVASCSDDNTFRVWRVDFRNDSKDEFLGWCERKAGSKVQPVPLDTLSRTSTPTNSPSRSTDSANNSATSSPVALSPNTSKSNSSQQVLQSWLITTTNKRPRETNTAISNTSKRYCLGSEPVPDTDNPTCLNTNGEVPADSYLNTNCKKISKSKTTEQNEYKDPNKENVDLGKCKTELGTESSQELLHSNGKKDGPARKGSPLTENKEYPKITSQDCNEDCYNMQSNMDCKHSLTMDDIRSKPPSPVIIRPASPDKELERILKHMKCITDYFKPVVKGGQGDDLSAEECER